MTMPHPIWIRRFGAHYPGEWVAIRDDLTVDHDVDRQRLLLRLEVNQERGFYLARVPDRKRP